MNSLEILKENKKAIANIYKALFDYLKKIADDKKIELVAKEPVVEAKSAEVEINNLALLRFSGSTSSGTYTLGYCNPDFMTAWNQFVSPPPEVPNPNIKSLEFELMKTIYKALEIEFKTLGIGVDPRSAMIQDGISLGGWSKIHINHSIQLPMQTKSGNLIFEIPVYNMEFAKKMTEKLYGFKESARMLVVDDSLVSRKASRNLLAMAGYTNVEETADGQQAFSKISGSQPSFDLVVADWHMPVMSGLDLLKKLRAIDEFKKLPIILLTGEKNKDEVVSAIREGVTAYLVKPVAPDSFLKTLKKASGQP